MWDIRDEVDARGDGERSKEDYTRSAVADVLEREPETGPGTRGPAVRWKDGLARP